MDYMYVFRQAHQDRLEDAGINPRHLRQPMAELGYPAQRKSLAERVRRTLTAMVNLLVR